jgi:hypothetical protein
MTPDTWTDAQGAAHTRVSCPHCHIIIRTTSRRGTCDPLSLFCPHCRRSVDPHSGIATPEQVYNRMQSINQVMAKVLNGHHKMLGRHNSALYGMATVYTAPDAHGTPWLIISPDNHNESHLEPLSEALRFYRTLGHPDNISFGRWIEERTT